MSPSNSLGRWVGETKFFSGMTLGLTARYLLKRNLQNYTKSLPKDYTLWKTWVIFLKMGGNGLYLGEEICSTVRWG